MSQLENIHQEMKKHKNVAQEANYQLTELKEDYRIQLVNNCISELLKIQEEENEKGETLTKRDFEIFLKNLSVDIRELYTR